MNGIMGYRKSEVVDEWDNGLQEIRGCNKWDNGLQETRGCR